MDNVRDYVERNSRRGESLVFCYFLLSNLEREVEPSFEGEGVRMRRSAPGTNSIKFGVQLNGEEKKGCLPGRTWSNVVVSNFVVENN